MNHLIWNLFAQIKRGQEIRRLSLLHPKSKLCCKILDILWNEGYIVGYRTCPYSRVKLEVFLKYYKGKPVIGKITSVSKPNLRVRLCVKELWKLNNGLGLIILSTSKGVLSDKSSKKRNVGGEIFCIIK
jgi:small subunit ribosomal protein S8